MSFRNGRQIHTYSLEEASIGDPAREVEDARSRFTVPSLGRPPPPTLDAFKRETIPVNTFPQPSRVPSTPPTPRRVHSTHPLWLNPFQILLHSTVGGLRTAILAYGARGLLVGLAAILRFIRERGKHPALLIEVFWAPECRSFAEAAGGFSFTWKFVYNFLNLIRGKTDGWNSGVAGALAGLWILAEHPDRRRVLLEQVGFRAAQVLYNRARLTWGFDLPHGSTLLFILCVGPITYSLAMRPETLPETYTNSLIDLAGLTPEILDANIRNVRALEVVPGGWDEYPWQGGPAGGKGGMGRLSERARIAGRVTAGMTLEHLAHTELLSYVREKGLGIATRSSESFEPATTEIPESATSWEVGERPEPEPLLDDVESDFHPVLPALASPASTPGKPLRTVPVPDLLCTLAHPHFPFASFRHAPLVPLPRFPRATSLLTRFALLYPHLSFSITCAAHTLTQLLPLHLGLALLSLVLFRGPRIRRDPIGETLKSLWTALRSSGTIGALVMVYIYLNCGVAGGLVRSGWWRKAQKWQFLLSGFIASLCIFLESPSRRRELAAYVLPLALECSYRILMSRGVVGRVPQWRPMLFSASCAVMMAVYVEAPNMLGSLAYALLKTGVGSY
ncbi:hypothetical protein M427DRAFT_70165 [Gonapodya prolifera JEL478]|uniref:Transmembrane protein 135 N-terminal domain-containing protein n=1 Tax=Gonapodya prolifera (strain JEL478) TaxID=1344416 RepID=A0A139AE17_GONPJ|nr:hypothetical protein M427DRAFT_70165 [Gonapodya prolifera JEL478]|eukprot:KXS15062.1 hypothetical protein M427DRAFT_70165 [Gonapodya prolifera JEL478]